MTQPSRHSVSVAAVVTDDQGRVLLIKRRDNGQWQIPGGVLELVESVHAGLVREVHEETGLWVEPGALTGVYKNMSLGVVALVFRARVIGGNATETDEASEVAWWPPKSVEAETSEAFAVRVMDALAGSLQVPIRYHDGVNLLDDNRIGLA